MELDLQQKHKYISNHLAIACSAFSQMSYESKCFQELVSLILDDEFKKNFNYAIYCDDFMVKSNIFLPRFHTYYLNSDTKDVVLMDEQLIDLPQIYDHHRYYIYDDKKLFDKFEAKHNNIKHIKSLKEIVNVPTNE